MTDSMPLSPREAKRREFILNGNLWSVVVTITAPLALYAVFNYLYAFFDTVLAARIDSAGAASVLIFDDIRAVVQAIGIGVAAAGTVFVARHYGAGEFTAARRSAGAMTSLAVLLSAVFSALAVLFWRPLLAVLDTPTEVVEGGLGYYAVQMASNVLVAFNAAFMGIERAKGRTQTILVLNIVAMVVKMGLSALFVLVLDQGLTGLALATLCAQGLLALLATTAMFGRGAIGIRLGDLVVTRDYALPILRLALPVIAGKALFSVGRVIVNAIATTYGTDALAAFSIGTRIGGAAGALTGVFEDPTTAVVSQNIGARKLSRAIDAYAVNNLLAVAIGAVVLLFSSIFLMDIIPLFVPTDPALAPAIAQVYFWERFSALTGATAAIVAAFFLGFKNTKVTFILNVIRLFVLRIPALLLFIAVGASSAALGWIMFLSNTGTALVALTFVVAFRHRVKAYGFQDMRLETA